jgi:flagellar biosynthesis/type III secretory pathway ATPase
MLERQKMAVVKFLIGAYVGGNNPRVDLAVSKIEAARHFLHQGVYETASYDDSVAGLSVA